MAPAQNNVGCCNGAGVGILSIGDLALDYLVYFDINGAAAGTGYDQIAVTGTVALNPSATLNLAMSASFVPTIGQEFVLINNDRCRPCHRHFQRHAGRHDRYAQRRGVPS
jgi:hypothetical protein